MNLLIILIQRRYTEKTHKNKNIRQKYFHIKCIENHLFILFLRFTNVCVPYYKYQYELQTYYKFVNIKISYTLQAF